MPSGSLQMDQKCSISARSVLGRSSSESIPFQLGSSCGTQSSMSSWPLSSRVRKTAITFTGITHSGKVGADTQTFEVRPPIANPGTPAFEVFPVHMLVIADNGVNIIENYFLEEIAAAGEHEFVLVVPPLKTRGGTGSALRSFALVP